MLFEIQEALEAVRDFLELGGGVLTLITLLVFFMWALILERLLYLKTRLKSESKTPASQWNQRSDHTSWAAHQMRNSLVAEVNWNARKGIDVIKTCVALCPLLGLLGTVTGMIEVFDVMAISGTGNARSMAAGVSKATVPTMAGMVAAISGLFPSIYLERQADQLSGQFEDEVAASSV
ncbi:MAG: MotA/TolQ/ExbB proton channel family protein [Pseudomonadota bacterium]